MPAGQWHALAVVMLAEIGKDGSHFLKVHLLSVQSTVFYTVGAKLNLALYFGLEQ